MKRGLVILTFVLALSVISALPILDFLNPTPAHNSQTTSNYFQINSSLTNFTNFIFNFDGTNFSIFDSSLILMMNLNNNSNLGENNSFVRDSSIYQNNGTANNLSFSTSSFVKAISLNESSLINITDSDEFHSENFTISLRIKTTPDEIKQIFSFHRNTCILLYSGEVYCVGDNTYGQLGDGTTTTSYEPVKVSGGFNFSSLAHSHYPSNVHMCGLLQNGSAMCWGEGSYGKLGNGGTADSFTPVFVSGNFNYSMIAVGRYDSCGLLINGTLLCWGRDNSGQLGCGNCGDQTTPNPVSGGNTFSSISAGDSMYCGLLQNGSALCWGRNGDGEIGDNSTTQRAIPTPVYGNYNFSSIQGGNQKTCGILTNGSVFCWGGQGSGTGSFPCGGGLGDGTCDDSTIPVPIYGNYNFSELESHYVGFCGLLQNGSAMCWGKNTYGVLGNNQTIDSLVPVFVSGNYNFSLISGASFHFVGITNESQIYTWGADAYGQKSKGVATLVLRPLLLEKGNFSSISIGAYYLCGLFQNGSAVCWGYNNEGNLGDNTEISRAIPVPILGDYVISSIETFYATNYGILANGSLISWGDNEYGQLGNGSSGGNGNSPVFVSGNYNFSSVYPGPYDCCGILTNYSTICWGRNNYGALGDGTTTQRNDPVFVSGNHNFSLIAPGAYHTCGLLQNGSALCWGRNNYGQLGNGSSGEYTTIPQLISGEHNFSTLSSGLYNSCGLLQNGSALCWGINTYGQIGDNSNTLRNIPTPVYGDYNFSEISGKGLYNSCGLLQNGSALCWGYNSNGQLGDGTQTTRIVPTPVYGDNNFSSIKISYFSSCGFLTNGNLLCWGNNEYEELVYPSVNLKVPTPGFYKGTLFGKTTSSFKIGSTFDGYLRVFTNDFFTDVELDEGYNHITFTSDGTTGKLYKNGELSSSFENHIYSYYNDTSNILIGNNSWGTEIDELQMWNRTLSASEVSQLYKTNLKQVNATHFEFYSNQSIPEERIYTYYLFASNSFGNSNILRNIIRYTPTTSTTEEESSSTGVSVYSPTESQLKEGYSKLIKAKQKVSITINEKENVIEIKSVNSENNKVEFSIGENNYEVGLENSVKIDTDGDGFYDLEVSVSKVQTNGYAELEFKEIYEKVPKEVQEEQNEKVVGEKIILTQNNLVYYIAGIVLVGLIVLIIIRNIRIKKIKKRYGYHKKKIKR